MISGNSYAREFGHGRLGVRKFAKGLSYGVFGRGHIDAAYKEQVNVGGKLQSGRIAAKLLRQHGGRSHRCGYFLVDCVEGVRVITAVKGASDAPFLRSRHVVLVEIELL